MRIEISDFYREKGYDRVYVSVNKEPRRVATLRKPNKEMHSMSYAKYLYTSHFKVDIPEGDQVDHIDGDRMNDVIENLQVISRCYNNRKDKKHKEMVEFVCPVCGKHFLIDKRDVPFRKNPTCSRECGRKSASEKIKSKYEHGKLICNIKYSDVLVAEIKKFYNECKSYKKTMNKFGIKNSSSLCYIIKNR